MPSEIPKTPNPLPAFEITQPKDGVTRFYANVATLTWSGSDLTVHLYQLIQPNRQVASEKDAPNQLLHGSSITVTWATAKLFYTQLAEVIERYEKVHGPIATEFPPI